MTTWRRDAPESQGRGPRIPKVREYAELFLADGTVLKGHVFLDATTRIQDMLNGPGAFFAFVDEDGNVHLVAKSGVLRVRPYD